MNRRIQDISLPTRTSETSAGPDRKRKTPAANIKKKPTSKTAKVAPKKKISTSKRQSRTPRVSAAPQKSRGTSVLWGAALVLLLILGYVVSHTFAVADVQVTLKQQRLTVGESFSAFQDTAEGQLDFDTVVFEGSVSKIVAEADSESVAEKASGVIVVYNAHQTTPQRLIEETRFEASNGQVYKTAKGVTTIVPGYTIEGGEIVPGSASVSIYASEAGEEYNQGPTDFTIPGFSGTPKFDGFYARSETPLEGGFVGERPTMTDLQAEETELELAARLRLNAEEEARYRIPEGYMVIPEAVTVAAGQTQFVKKDSGFEASLSGEVTALLIQEDELTDILLSSQEEFAGLSSADIQIVNLDQLTYQVEEISEEEISIKVSGDMLVRWLITEENVKRLVLGVKKKDFQERLESEDAIQSTQVELSPLWVTTFPKKMDNITIIFQNIDR